MFLICVSQKKKKKHYHVLYSCISREQIVFVNTQICWISTVQNMISFVSVNLELKWNIKLHTITKSMKNINIIVWAKKKTQNNILITCIIYK